MFSNNRIQQHVRLEILGILAINLEAKGQIDISIFVKEVCADVAAEKCNFEGFFVCANVKCWKYVFGKVGTKL